MEDAKLNQLSYVKASLGFLHPHMSDDYVVEMSAMGCAGFSKLWAGRASGGMTSGWFSSLEKLAALAVDIDCGWLNNGGYKMTPSGIYITMNPVTPALLSRSYNVVTPGVPRTSDKDVSFYHNFFIDIDADRPTDTSASEDEKAASKDTALKVKDYLVNTLAWPTPMFCDSGNGYHLVFKCYFPAEKEHGELLRVFLSLLQDAFCASPYIISEKQIRIKVDTSVHNPARLIKLHGTTARKGMPTPNRPQRQSYIIELPQDPSKNVVSVTMLEDTVQILASHLGREEKVIPTQKEAQKAPDTQRARRPGVEEMFTSIDEVTPIIQGGHVDVQKYLNDNGYKVKELRVMENEGPTLYILEKCIFDASHRGKAAAIGQHRNGLLFYQCFHESCKTDVSRSWAAARKIISGDAKLGRWMTGGFFGVAFPHINEDGKPYARFENFKALLQGYGITLWYNEMTRQTEAILPGNLWEDSDKKMTLTRALILEKCAKHGLATYRTLDNWMHLESEANKRHPVKDWIQSKPWDGQDRMEKLAATILVPEDQYHIWRLYLRRWLIQGVAALYHPFFSGKGVLTFTGKQNVGKTSWLRRLTGSVPDAFMEGAQLDPKLKDSILGVIGSWIAELGELDATFNKGDIARIKAFLSNTGDRLRVPYGKDQENFKRQTIFSATVNDPQFLVDSTGNSRWWVVDTLYVNYNHQVDVQQVWAHAFQLYCNGEAWHLTAGESDLQSEMNRAFEVTDPIEEKILACFKFDTPRGTWTHEMTSTQVLEYCGYRQPNRADTTKAGNILIRLCGRSGRKRQEGVRGKFYGMPVERNPYEENAGPAAGGSATIIPFVKGEQS
jgi:hypothetical protein